MEKQQLFKRFEVHELIGYFMDLDESDIEKAFNDPQITAIYKKRNFVDFFWRIKTEGQEVLVEYVIARRDKTNQEADERQKARLQRQLLFPDQDNEFEIEEIPDKRINTNTNTIQTTKQIQL